MKFYLKPKGSSLIVAMGIMSLLLVLGGTVMTTIFRSAHLTNNIANANKAYFAAESGLEEALYELTNHLTGFETTDAATLTNNSKYDFEIESREAETDTTIPPADKGNSPNNSDWNKIEHKDTYSFNLFYDTSTKGNTTDYDCSDGDCDIVNPSESSISEFNLYIRTPNGQTLKENDDVFVSWLFTGTDINDPNTKYTIFPITTKDFSNTEITNSKIETASSSDYIVLNLNTSSAKLESSGSTTINAFLNNANLHMPRLKLSVVSELISNTNDPIPYLEFRIEAEDAVVPNSFATITSEGYAGITKQSIQTKIKQEGALALFDYAIFQ